MFTLRLKLDSRLREDPLGFSDGLFFHNGDDLRFELGLFRDGVVVDDLTQVAVQLKSANATSEDAAWFVEYDNSPSAALTAATWKAGTAETATVDVAATYTSIPAGNYLLTISATTSGGEHETYYAGTIVVSESGYGTSTVDNIGALLYYDAITSDARFARKSYESRVEALEIAFASPMSVTPYATVADLPAGANGTGDTIFGYVYNDDPDNGLYFEEDASSTWALVAGDPNARITAAEADIVATDERTAGVFNQSSLIGETYPVIIDEVGRLILGVDSVSGALIGRGILDQISTVYDQNPNDLIVIDADGKYIFDSRDLDITPAVAIPAAAKIWDIELIVYYGQSNNAGFIGTPVINRLPSATHLGSAAGAWDAINGIADIGALIETELAATANGARGEYGGYALTDRLDDEWEPYDGSKPVYLFLSSAIGSKTYANLAKGSAHIPSGLSVNAWDYMFAQIGHIKDYADGNGLTIGCRAVYWDQGEANTGEAAASVTSNLTQLQVDFDTDIKALFTQSEDVHLFIAQTSYNMVGVAATEYQALGQLEAADENLIHMVSPKYGTPPGFVHVESSPVQAHENSYGKCYYAYLFAESMIDEFIGSGNKSLKIVSVSSSADVITLTFDAKTENLPIVLDKTAFGKVTNFGFSITNASGATVTNVISHGNTVYLTCSGSLTAGASTLRYALDYNRPDVATSLLNAGAGNLRDSNQGFKMVAGVKIPQWKWVPAFSYAFTAT
jgi:hypothetical protein